MLLNNKKLLQKSRKRKLLFYKIATDKLINTYGKEGAIPYLKVLFREEVKE